jgi:hypothetical protein
LKKLAIVGALGVLVLASGSWAGAGQTSTRSSNTDRAFAALSGASRCSTAVTQASLKCLKSELIKVQKALNCLRTVGVSSYGDASGGTFGYVWRDSTSNPPEFLTSALDYDNRNTADYQFYVSRC